jgi:acetyl-CoA carboxylase carboxyl transferase subunit alpha
MITPLDFERPITDLEAKIADLKQSATADMSGEISKLQAKVDRMLADTYSKLTPWQKTMVARHPQRPHFRDYVARLMDDFMPLAGDRNFAEDCAILGGPARFRGRAVMVIGHEKGHDTQTRLKHNFGMAKPEGYRKVVRLLQMAEKFSLPVITLVDTSGAFPGVQAEERGQAEAIARSTQMCLELSVPMVAAIVGEGGSGGAVALATGNRMLMFEHAIYSVISPEGCASILWRTSDKAADAAQALKLTAQDLFMMKVIDYIVTEPTGGAHRNRDLAMSALGQAIDSTLAELLPMTPEALRADRRTKYLAMGRANAA